MKTVEVTTARGNLKDYVKRMGKGPLLLTQAGKPVAALVSMRGTDMESAKLSTDPWFILLLERSRERAKREGTVSHEEMLRRFGMAAPKETRRRRARVTAGKA
jgi:prevent-host-death family protein